MNINTTIRSRRCVKIGISLFIAIGLGVCILPSAVRADLTVNEKLTITRVDQSGSAPSVSAGATATASATPPPVAQHVTLYFKNGNARTETDGGIITIFNNDDQKVYTLDRIRQTYYVQPLLDVAVPMITPPGGPPLPTEVDDAITVHPGELGQTFAGMQSRVYLVSGTVTIRAEHRSREVYVRHHHTWGGGYYVEDAAPPIDLAKTVQVSGEYWLSDAVKIPDSRKAILFPALYIAAQPERYVFKPLADNLAKKRMIPLSSRIAVTRRAFDGTQETITTSTEVTDFSRQPLPDSLFDLPIGYTLIAPPSN